MKPKIFPYFAMSGLLLVLIFLAIRAGLEFSTSDEKNSGAAGDTLPVVSQPDFPEEILSAEEVFITVKDGRETWMNFPKVIQRAPREALGAGPPEPEAPPAPSPLDGGT